MSEIGYKCQVRKHTNILTFVYILHFVCIFSFLSHLTEAFDLLLLLHSLPPTYADRKGGSSKSIQCPPLANIFQKPVCGLESLCQAEHHTYVGIYSVHMLCLLEHIQITCPWNTHKSQLFILEDDISFGIISWSRSPTVSKIYA